MLFRKRVLSTGLILIFTIAWLVPGLCWPSQAAASMSAPTVITNGATNVVEDEATLGGEIYADGGADITEYGFCYGTTSSCTTKMKVGTSINEGESFDCDLTNLRSDTRYYFKAYAKNIEGTRYGAVKYFTTDEGDGDDPEVTTESASSIGDDYATLNGEIDSDGGEDITEYGFYYGKKSSNLTKKRVGTRIDENDNFKYRLTGLNDDTKYYFKAYAKNSNGTDYGTLRSFTTDDDDNDGYYPSVTTKTPSIGGDYATLYGAVNSNGDSDIESYGFYYGTSSSPTNKISVGYDDIDEDETFSYQLSGLSPGITYYVKAYATNERGTAYGNILSFKGSNGGSAIGLYGNPSIFYINSKNYYLRGVFQTGDVAPYVKNNRTFLPIRTVAYALGITDSDISWNEATQIVTLKKDSKVVQLTINNKIMYMNGTPVMMDTAPETVNGRTCLPVALIVNAFGGTASWDPYMQSVTIQMY